MEIRCHLCGAVLGARDAVRRKMVVNSTSFHGSGLVQQQPALWGGASTAVSMVDLCRGCDRREQDREDERAAKAAREIFVTKLVAYPILAALIITFICLCIFLRP